MPLLPELKHLSLAMCVEQGFMLLSCRSPTAPAAEW